MCTGNGDQEEPMIPGEGGGGGGWYLGFQVMGMIEGFFGLAMWQVFFWGWLDLSTDFWGYYKHFKNKIKIK